MELKKAIARVTKVCPRKKELDQFRRIRLLPRVGDVPARVFATDGQVMSIVDVDVDLPNRLVGSELLSKAVKGAKNLELVETGAGHLEARAEGSVFQVACLDMEHFPLPPILPESLVLVPEWKEVQRVLHAAARESEGATLATVHFTPAWVEATDKARLARVSVSAPWAGVIPVKLFKNWPKGDVYTAFTEHHAIFKVEEELRIAGLLQGDYLDTKNIIPTVNSGGFVLVPVPEFTQAVKWGADIPGRSVIGLEFGSTEVTVTAWAETGVVAEFRAKVPVLHGNNFSGNVVLVGCYLVQALKEVTTPNVRLCFGTGVDPLRIESGWYTECIWPHWEETPD